MQLVDALRQHDTVTENGMLTNSTSLNACTDLFFTIGAMRGQDKERLLQNFSKAYAEDPTRAMKILFWARDVRGGAGERQIFRDILKYLAEHNTNSVLNNIKEIPVYGRWDDVLELLDTKLEEVALLMVSSAIYREESLCAKWMPRKGTVANKIRKYLGFSPKQYRKTLVNLTNVVETKMCANDWTNIEYGKLPSVASARYQKAFSRNDVVGYNAYIESLEKGEAKINAGAVYPYDVTKTLNYGIVEVANAQWTALPNYMEGSNDMILPVVDVSGSMDTAAGTNNNVTCMDVSVSLGLYISERNKGPFKDAFITFSERPELQVLKGNLSQRYEQLVNSEWGMNTDLNKVFDLILNHATKFSVAQKDMPTKILILSDMEFDVAIKGDKSLTAIEMIRERYAAANYEMPQIVFWNIQSRGKNVPVRFNEDGTALVSGFSPAIMKALINGKIESPVQIMDTVILGERYEAIKA
jgi:hypothetical protein